MHHFLRRTVRGTSPSSPPIRSRPCPMRPLTPRATIAGVPRSRCCPAAQYGCPCSNVRASLGHSLAGTPTTGPISPGAVPCTGAVPLTPPTHPPTHPLTPLPPRTPPTHPQLYPARWCRCRSPHPTHSLPHFTHSTFSTHPPTAVPRALVPVPLEFNSPQHWASIIANNLLAEFYHAVTERTRWAPTLRCGSGPAGELHVRKEEEKPWSIFEPFTILSRISRTTPPHLHRVMFPSQLVPPCILDADWCLKSMV